MDIEKIKSHYDGIILKSKFYKSTKPVNELELLYPEFIEKLIKCFKRYSDENPGEEVYVVETYRSNSLQLKYFLEGKSKIKKNGMHHYGLAADVAFYINGKFSYEGDYLMLRRIFAEEGLTVLKWELGHVQYVKVSEQPKVREMLN